MLLKKSIALGLLCSTLLVCSCGHRGAETDKRVSSALTPTGNFSVSILKIGKADAIILKTENHTALIDCGESEDGAEIIKYLKKSGTEKIDYMFITHFDKDHVGGAPDILDSFPVGEIITPDYEGSVDEYYAYINALEDKNLTAASITEDMTITLDDVTLNVYPPLRTSYEEGDNDFSLIISAVHGGNSFLFTGDAEKERLAELSSQLDLEHTFLKMPHHGNYNKGTKAFVQSVKPKYTVITCSDKNPPDDETLSVLKSIGSDVYETSDGDVTAVSDGKIIKISQ